MRATKKLMTLILILLVFNQCNENQTKIVPNKIQLSKEELQQITISSIRLTSYWSSLASGKNRISDFTGINIRSSIQDYINRITDPNEKAFNLAVLENKNVQSLLYLSELEPNAKINEFFESNSISEGVKEMTSLLQTAMNDIITNYVGTAITFNESDLSSALQAGIRIFENEINGSLNLTSDEKKALLISIELQYQTTPAMVTTAKTIFESLSQQEGGRTAGFWKKLGNIVASVVIHAAVAAFIVVAIVSTAGIGGWLAAPLLVGTFSFVTGGVALGAGIGFTVGVGMAATGQCLDGIFDGNGKVWYYTDCN